MATIHSLLWVRLRSATTALPPSAALPLRALPGWLRRRRVGTANRDLATLAEADKAGRHDTLGRLKTLADHRLRLVLFLHGDRQHRDGVVIFDHVYESTVWASLHRASRDNHNLLE